MLFRSGTTISLGSENAASVSNRGNSESLTLKNITSVAGAKVTYLTYPARGYEELQRVLLCLSTISGAGERVQVYGLPETILGDTLTFENAPAMNPDGTVNLRAVYGGAPLASFSAISAGSNAVAVSAPQLTNTSSAW